MRSGRALEQNQSDKKAVIAQPENKVELNSLYVEKFKDLQEILSSMFQINVPYEKALSFPWVKDEFYAKVVEGLLHDEYFALDFMMEEGLLSPDDLRIRGIKRFHPQALSILSRHKGPRHTQALSLFLRCGLVSEKDIQSQ